MLSLQSLSSEPTSISIPFHLRVCGARAVRRGDSQGHLSIKRLPVSRLEPDREARGLGTLHPNGWFAPSISELSKLYFNMEIHIPLIYRSRFKKVNAVIKSHGFPIYKALPSSPFFPFPGTLTCLINHSVNIYWVPTICKGSPLAVVV